jgi:hypothetical protein
MGAIAFRSLDRGKFEHSFRDIETDYGPGGLGGKKSEVAGACRQVQHLRLALQTRQSDQPTLPSAILTVRKHDRDEIVAIRNAGKEPADIPTLS